MSLVVQSRRGSYDSEFLRIHLGTLAFVVLLTIAEWLYIFSLPIQLPKDWPGVMSVCIALLVVGLLLHKVWAKFALAINAMGLVLLAIPSAGLASALLFYSGRHMPTIDPTLAELDSLLHFNWRLHVEWLMQYPDVIEVLGYAYYSILYQPLIILIILSCRQDTRQMYSFVNALILPFLALLFCVYFFPALGPYEFYKGETIVAFGPSTGSIVKPPMDLLRGGQPDAALKILSTGMIYFPSYHTIVALVYTWVMWGVPYIRWGFLAINVGMLVATPYHGCHYLSDMIAGAFIGVISIVLVRRLLGPSSIERVSEQGSRWTALRQ